MPKEKQDYPVDIAAKLGIGKYRRHIILCAGPKCCLGAEGQKIWDYLKQRCKDLGLTPGGVFRSKAHCLRVCKSGPIAVVYPEGSWYCNLDIDKCELVIQEHLIKGMPVGELIFASNPIP